MNRKQKRELLKRRRARQKYLKYEAPLDRLEHALGALGTQAPRCFAKKDGHQCFKLEGHDGIHEARNENNLPVFWRDV